MRRIHKVVRHCCWLVGRGNFEIAEMLVFAGAGVSAANDTTLLYSFGVVKLKHTEMLVSKGANVSARVRMCRRSGRMMED